MGRRIRVADRRAREVREVAIRRAQLLLAGRRHVDAVALHHVLQLAQIQQDVERELGKEDAIGRILAKSAEEYALVIELLEARGTPRFYELSRELYGSARDTFPDDVVRVRERKRGT